MGEEISAMTEQNMALTDEVSDLKEKIDENAELINSLKQENQELERVISEYREKELEKPIEIGSTQNFVQPFDDESESIIRDLKNENQDLIQELNNLRSKLTTESGSFKKVEELTAEIQRLKEEKAMPSREPGPGIPTQMSNRELPAPHVCEPDPKAAGVPCKTANPLQVPG